MKKEVKYIGTESRETCINMGVTPSRLESRPGRRNPSNRSNTSTNEPSELILAHSNRWFFYEYPIHEREEKEESVDEMGTGGEPKPEPEKPMEVEEPKPEPAPEPPKPVTPEPTKPQEPLNITYIEYNRKKNEKSHFTNQYDPEEGRTFMVVRRGQPFLLTVETDRPYIPGHDEIRIVFELGMKPSPSNNTQITMHMKKGLIAKSWKWSCEYVSHTDNKLVVRVQPANQAIIGRWNVIAQTSLFKPPEGTPKKFNRFKHFSKLYVIFNPYNKEDQVYMENEDELDEYVMAETGHIFVGNSRQPWGRPWNFGQFEEDILDVAMMLLDLSGISYKVRGNPIYIARALSAAANQADENGVLVGNWSGDYSGGVSPTSWAGSVKILQQFWETKQPVQYGQCWVFSGIVTTLCRALGMPTRSVTNFSSAHDTDESCTIDVYWTEDGEKDEWRNSDSVWNFHVWNEAWMKRPDLTQGDFNGWQAFDATPQETSDGIYQAGPAPCKAIKEGDIDKRYDSPFIFAEVNADRVNWKFVDGEYVVTTIEKHRIGINISTNLPRNITRPENPYAPSFEKHRLDVTDHYKYREGSKEERAAVLRAHSKASAPREGIYDFNTKDVAFDIAMKDGILLGSNFDVVLKLQNKSREQRTVKVNLSLKTAYYTGVIKDSVKSKKFDLKLGPIKGDEAVMRVTFEEYMYKLTESATFLITVDAVVYETFQNHSTEESFRLRRPDVEIEGPKKIKVGKEFEITAKFASSLSIPLTNCVWEIEAAGITKPKEIPEKDCAPYDRREIKIPLKAKKPGDRKIIVSFTSKELHDVVGEFDIKVKDD